MTAVKTKWNDYLVPLIIFLALGAGAMTYIASESIEAWRHLKRQHQLFQMLAEMSSQGTDVSIPDSPDVQTIMRMYYVTGWIQSGRDYEMIDGFTNTGDRWTIDAPLGDSYGAPYLFDFVFINGEQGFRFTGRIETSGSLIGEMESFPVAPNANFARETQ